MSKSGFGLMVLMLSAAALLFPSACVLAQGWSGPVAISSGIRNADSPQVAVGPDGQVVAAFTEWSQINEFTWLQQSFANVFDGSAWGTAQRIDSGNDAWESTDPRVAMDSGGNAFAAFEESTSAFHVYFNRWDGSVWVGAAPVDEGLGRQSNLPEVAMGASGTAMVAFKVIDTPDRIFAGYWNGSAWTSLQRISPLGASTNADSPGIAMDRTGNAVAVWRQYGTPNRIYGCHWNGSSWAISTAIDMSWEAHALAPRVVMDGSGNALAVFRQDEDPSITAYYRACANWWNGTSWTGATTIDAGTGTSVTGTNVALNSRGEALATFVQSDGSKARVWATLWDGSSWSVPVIVDADTEWRVGYYSAPVAIDGAGRGIVTFTESTTDGLATVDIRTCANIWDGSSWAGAAAIDSGPDRWADNPQVAIDPSGHAMVVFDQRDGSDTHVYANRYVFPSRSSSVWNYDYNGDGTSEIAVFRETTGLWAIRGLTRVYFGRSGDLPSPGDYDGNGTTDLAVFRGSSGLWAARGVTRAYFGGSADDPLPRDYDGDGTTDLAIRRPATGLWAVRGVTRVYFGASGDDPVPGDFHGYGTAGIGIFRPASSLWASRSGERIYFGGSGDRPVIAGYDSYPGLDPAVFRASTGLWAVRGITRAYFGTVGDDTVPADYDGDGIARIGVFRPATGLWAIRGLTRIYFGGAADQPVAR